MSPAAESVARAIVVDARESAARAVLLGLPAYRRVLLAAHYAEASAVLWVADEAARAALAEELAGDPRLREVPLEVASADAEPPAGVTLVPGAAVVDKAAVGALAEGAPLPPPRGLYLPPELDPHQTRRRLLRSLENPCDGLVDTWINRPISRQLTRLLVGTGISPNAVTVISFLIGVMGVAGIATRDWALGIAGALLFQLSAAVDCVDGEIARLTYRFSPLGARLDLALDNVVHVLLFAAIGWACTSLLEPQLAAALGGAAVLGGSLSFAVVYRLTFASGGRDSGLVRRILDRVTNRDFSLLVIAVACWGRWDLLLWVLAIGTNLFWLALGATALWTRREP